MTDKMMSPFLEELRSLLEEGARDEFYREIWAVEDLEWHAKELEKYNAQRILSNAGPSDESNQLIDEAITEIKEVSSYIKDMIAIRDISREKKATTISCFGILPDYRSRLLHSSIKLQIGKLKQHILDDANRIRRINKPVIIGSTNHEYDEYNTDRNVVGLEEVKDQLIQQLVSGGNELEFISVCGLGGSGKTTLAREVYNDSRISYEFYSVSWISMSPNFNMKDILLHILRMFTKRTEAYESSSQMRDAIRGFVSKGGRRLFVLDDVCSPMVNWDELRHILADTGKAHRILFTTREREIAISATSNPLFTKSLGDKDAWKLFMEEYRRHNREYKLEAEKEKLGKEIVKDCAGLPVAIIKLAQELAARESTEEWKVVHQSIMSFLSKVLARSFDALSNDARPYCIYLSIWPEESMIDVEKLYHFWIVEGLVKPQVGRTKEILLSVAEHHLEQLVRSGIVEVTEEEEVPTIRKLKSCRVHRMMRERCISKGNRIKFSHIIDFPLGSNSASSSSRNKTRHLFVRLEKTEDISSILANKELTCHLHSLQFLAARWQQHKEPVRLSGKFKDKDLCLLKLLDFDGIDFRQDELPTDQGMSGLLEGISKLVHLRYLSFKGCFMDRLPSTISNLSFLEILDLRVEDSTTEVALPNVLWKMRKMKHLCLPRIFRTHDREKLRLESLTELETLENFITKVCNVRDLHSLTKLQYLSVMSDGYLPDLKFITELVREPENKQIQLSIDVRNFDCFEENKHSVVRELLQYQGIQIFCIEGHIHELPLKHNVSRSLIKIVLTGSELKKDPLQTLAMLPQLRVLVLDDNAFVGTDMVSPALGYRALKRLDLMNFLSLERWTIANESMPKVCKIKIENCKKLTRIPDGIKFLTALKDMEITKMPKPFVDRLRDIDGRQGEDMAIVKDVNIIFSATDEKTRSQDEPSSSSLRKA